MIATGYIVHDNETIHGIGDTADAAWADMQKTMMSAQVTLLSDDQDSSEQSGSWTRESNLKIAPATAALLTSVFYKGGNCGWRQVGVIACTRDEAEEQ